MDETMRVLAGDTPKQVGSMTENQVIKDAREKVEGKYED